MALAFFESILIGVRGGGDLASGVVYRLHRAGFPVVVTELEVPTFVRRAVSYGEAVYSESIIVDGVTARLAENVEQAEKHLAAQEVPVLVDPDGFFLNEFKPVVVVDARMAKVNLGTTIGDAPQVICLGPGFTAGVDCHAVIETNRGHDLGRVIVSGVAEANTGTPGSVQNQTHVRVLRAPNAGHVKPLAAIGDVLEERQPIAEIGGETLVALFHGVLRGLIHERVKVQPGMKIGDLDPRAKRENCFTISDKSLAIGGGVLEAVFAAEPVRRHLARIDHEIA